MRSVYLSARRSNEYQSVSDDELECIRLQQCTPVLAQNDVITLLERDNCVEIRNQMD